MKIFQWRYSLFLMLFALCLSAGSAQAALTVTCIAGMNTTPGSTGNVSLGTITPANADSANITGNLNYSCTNTGNTAGYVSVCFAADGGVYDNKVIAPRYMTGPSSPLLAFAMTHSGGTLWGTRTWNGKSSEYNTGWLYINKRPGGVGTSTPITGSVPINISLLPGYNNYLATAGNYDNNFGNGNHTALTFSTSATLPAPDCTAPNNPGSFRFPFVVQATVIASCAITATSDVDLGPHSASATNITGSKSNAITMTCTNGGAYYIGLKPSKNNQNGAGEMSGTGANIDKVPYQLRSTAGIGGAIWGNTATSTTVGNGVAGFGSGTTQTHEVFVTVPSADFKPDNYSDTVTVNVNY